MTYSYDATLINDHNLNEMRFVLGDVQVEEPERDAYLSDEEISAALEGATFKQAALRLCLSLLARFSYEVDTKIDQAEWKLSQRLKAWGALAKRLQEELEAEEIIVGLRGLKGKGRPPIFKVGMHDVFTT